MELLGPNLEDLLKYCNKKFSLVTTIMLGQQIIEIIEHLHSKSYIHRDIKPENFVIGYKENANQIYMIDYGLAKRYRDSNTKSHIPFKDNTYITGTARYVSINTHLGIGQTRRDDVESCMYMLIYFLKGRLPWQGLKAATKKAKFDKIMEAKMATSVDALCQGTPSN